MDPTVKAESLAPVQLPRITISFCTQLSLDLFVPLPEPLFPSLVMSFQLHNVSWA